jgi:hypothetical protein
LFLPSDYSQDILGMTETDCGAATDPTSERAVDDCFERAYKLRKSFRGERKLQKQTLSPEQYRAKRNAEREERLRIAARRRQEPQAA